MYYFMYYIYYNVNIYYIYYIITIYRNSNYYSYYNDLFYDLL